MKDIPLFKVKMAEGLEKPLMDVLYSGYIGQGKKVEEFEKLLNEYFFPLKHILTVNSATSGLHLLLHMTYPGLSLSGTEVLASPLTCTASNFPILANNMKIKWVDVDQSCNIDLNDLERKLSPTTKIILLVHWGGNPIDLHRVEEIRKKCFSMYGFKPKVIQDNAHAIASLYDDLPLCHYYDSVYSFQAIKHFTTGDGGCVTFKKKTDYKRAKLLRWYGLDRENKSDFRCEQNIQEWGYKFHMNDINATIGIHNFPFINDTVRKHIDNSNYYDNELENISGVSIIKKTPHTISSQWIYTMHVERRKDFIKYMKENGVDVSQVHKRNDNHPCMHDYKVPLPTLDSVEKTMICIPNGWWVTKENREYIVNLIKKGW